eukprot:356466-Chlamydomonas_euryale.AAC.1
MVKATAAAAVIVAGAKTGGSHRHRRQIESTQHGNVQLSRFQQERFLESAAKPNPTLWEAAHNAKPPTLYPTPKKNSASDPAVPSDVSVPPSSLPPSTHPSVHSSTSVHKAAHAHELEER